MRPSWEDLRLLWRIPARERLREFQDRRLRRLVRHAYARVPFYRERWDAAGFHPDDFRGVEDLRRLPVVERSEIREAGLNALARGYRAKTLRTYRTSGSTGSPLTIRRTWFEDRYLHALNVRRQMELHGLRWTDRRCSLRIVGNVRPPGWYARLGLLQQEVVESRRPIETIVRQVVDSNPDVLSGYPGVVAETLREIRRRGDRLDRLRLVLCGGETITPALRRSLEVGAQGAPVRAAYGAHEANVLAKECPRGGCYHAEGSSAIVEVLRPDGAPAAAGEEGETVITPLHSFAMPFIRYRLGDFVRKGPTGCACGAPVETFEQILGRTVELFVTPGGRRFHPYAIALAASRARDLEVSGIRVIQHEPARIEMILQTHEPLPSDFATRVRNTVAGFLGEQLEIEARAVERLEPGPYGKFQPYISKVRPEAPASPAD